MGLGSLFQSKSMTQRRSRTWTLVRSARLLTCPATREKYFYASVPVVFVKNDVELQPRALEPERLWELYRHLRRYTQLQPAIARFVDGGLLVFDGQHKAAAQVWAGRDALDCKIYIDPDVRRIKETNLSAHDKLRQMPFYTSTLLEKYAGMASEDWEDSSCRVARRRSPRLFISCALKPTSVVQTQRKEFAR